MRRFHFSEVWLLIILIFSVFYISTSCVTKRKFTEMEKSRNLAENTVKDLTSENMLLKSDFERFENTTSRELNFKNNSIDSLTRIILLLNSDISSKDDNIEDQVFSFQLEKRELNQKMDEKEKEIRNLIREINTLKVQNDDLTKKIEEVTSNRKFPFGQVKQLERKLQARDTLISELNLKLVNAQIENSNLLVKINELSQSIEKLNSSGNQQKLDSIRNE
jgi:chromosome segregation ATPase